VPSERVFSSSAETDTKRRNRIHPGLFEALQILKFAIKQDRLDFMNHLLAKEKDYTIEGDLTEAAIEELILAGKTDELADLLKNALTKEGAETATDN
ncbi:hypothetical protein DFH06DRAFT_971238, partial [Mycena polygramma]